MQGRLIIYETTHHETLPAILDLAATYFEKTAVFLREKTYQHVSVTPAEQRWPDILFFRQPEDVSNRAFIRTTLQFARKQNYTHLHISTLDNNLLYFALGLVRQPRLRLSLSIQAIHEYRTFRFADFRDVTESAAKLFFHRRIKNYRVFFPKMTDLLLRSFPAGHGHYIPSRFFSGESGPVPEKTAVWQIVIPGSVDPCRRNYDFMISFVKDHLRAIAALRPVLLVLLGNIDTTYGWNLLERLKPLSGDGLEIKYYAEYVSQQEYEMQLTHADMIWSPVNLQTHGRRGTPEIYGESMATGMIADLLLSSCPALVPSGFDIPDHYQDTMTAYDAPDDLAGRIVELMREDQQSRRERIARSLSFFSKRQFEPAFSKLFPLDDGV
jgi:hypothetical protein